MKREAALLLLAAVLCARVAEADPAETARTEESEKKSAANHSVQAYPDLLALSAEPAAEKNELLRDSRFTVSSDEFDASESLNRISGKIDMGFSLPSQTYKSSDHYAAGPFAREKAVESS